MKRFLLVLALVAVAGATYVATAPGSQTAGPTAKQFRALKKQVAGLKTQLKNVKFVVLVDTQVLTDCMASSHPINQLGDDVTNSKGYMYSDPAVNSGTPFPKAALDYAASDDPNALWITGGTATCGTDINGPALRQAARLARALRR